MGTIEGNSRFMDVLLAGSIPVGEGKRAGQQGGKKQGGGKQGGGNQMQQMPQMMQMMQSFMNGKSGGKGVIKNNLKVTGKATGKKRDHSDDDPAGSGKVFV